MWTYHHIRAFVALPREGQPEGSPLYVMSKEDGRWLLVARQKTVVLDTP